MFNYRKISTTCCTHFWASPPNLGSTQYTGKIFVPVVKPHRYFLDVVRSVSATSRIVICQTLLLWEMQWAGNTCQRVHMSPAQTLVTSAADNLVDGPVDGFHRCCFVNFHRALTFRLQHRASPAPAYRHASRGTSPSTVMADQRACWPDTQLLTANALPPSVTVCAVTTESVGGRRRSVGD